MDEFVALTHCRRKRANCLITRDQSVIPEASPLARRIYSESVREALVVLWEAADRICGKRLKAVLPELIATMERHGHLALDTLRYKHLLTISPATIDRVLRPIRDTAGGTSSGLPELTRRVSRRWACCLRAWLVNLLRAMTVSSFSNCSGVSNWILAGGNADEEAGQHRLANIHRVQKGPEPGVGQPEVHGAADRRFIALDEHGSRVLIAGPYASDQLFKCGSLDHDRAPVVAVARLANFTIGQPFTSPIHLRNSSFFPFSCPLVGIFRDLCAEPKICACKLSTPDCVLTDRVTPGYTTRIVAGAPRSTPLD